MNRDIHRRVWLIAGPIIISNISVPLLGAVDTAVMGHLPDPKYLGGVAVGAMVFTFIYWGFGFLRMGTGGLTAQAFGAQDADEVRACLARAAVIGIPAALILIALQLPIAAVAFSILEASPDVETLAQEYFFVRIWGAPATLMNFALLGWFIGCQNTKAALWHQLSLNGVNIVLDLLFVLGLGWGVAGVAAATALADALAVVIGLFLALPILRRLGGRFVKEKILETAKIKRTIVLNVDIFIRTICLVFAFAYFTAQGAAFGNVVLAANAVLLNFQTFMAHALDGFAHAAEALGDSVRTESREYLLWAVAMPLVAVFPFLFDGIFLGATRGATMRNAMIVSLLIYLACCYFLVPLWGNDGLWAALTIFMGARGLTLGVRYPALLRSVGRQPQ